MNFKVAVSSFIFAITLTACQSESLPQKGYNQWKKQIDDYYASLGSSIQFKANYASYAWIIDSGTEDVGTLKDSVWYKVNYTVSATTISQSYFTYLVYQNGSVRELDSATPYNYAVGLVNKGALKGEVGSL